MNQRNEEPPEASKGRLTGMRGFTIIWVGQMLSLLGTAMTGFAIAVWAWQKTGQATTLALVGFFGFAPLVLASPLAGAIVDRYNRKRIMMLADLAAGLPTVAVLLLYTTNNLQIWHLYITGAVSAFFQAFHFPAYSAAVTMMLPKKHYARASGMLSTAQFASTIFAPVVAAILLVMVGLPSVLLVDISTFLFAISLLLLVHIPQPAVTEAGLKGKGSLLKESAFGFRYIYERASLLGLQLFFFSFNLISTFAITVLPAMILARTGDNALVLASVQSAAGVGGVVGSVAISVWGGPKRKVYGMLAGGSLTSLLGITLMGFGQGFVIWMVAAFLAMVFIPVVNASNQAIWQAKVAPDVQGRVFATRLLIAQISVPVAMLLAGPLADRFFEPAMMPSGSLAATFGGLVGTGPGAGMSVMFVISGILGAFVGLAGYLVPVVRNAEDILPDHEAKAAPSGEKPK
jgi:DHA3 family macrolide efflux protein-like MFS transporter